MKGSNIHETAVIYPNVILGENITIGPYAVIGGPPQVRTNRNAGFGVVIGDGAYIGPHCQIDGGLNERTKIGERAYLMGSVHVGHDCVIEPDATLSQGVTLAGHVRICEGATLGICASVHQHQIIGAFSMIGMGAVIPRRSFKALILPGTIWAGNPAEEKGDNLIGMERNGIDGDKMNEYRQKYLDKYPYAPI